MSDDLRTAEHMTPNGATSPGNPPRDPKRPHGGALLALGWTLMTIGGLAFVIALFASEISSPGRDGIGDIIPATLPVYNSWKWPTLYLGAALINIGFVVAALGLVVRALFFLPGRAVAWRELGGAIQKMEAEQEAEEARLRAAAARRDPAGE